MINASVPLPWGVPSKAEVVSSLIATTSVARSDLISNVMNPVPVYQRRQVRACPAQDVISILRRAIVERRREMGKPFRAAGCLGVVWNCCVPLNQSPGTSAPGAGGRLLALVHPCHFRAGSPGPTIPGGGDLIVLCRRLCRWLRATIVGPCDASLLPWQGLIHVRRQERRRCGEPHLGAARCTLPFVETDGRNIPTRGLPLHL